MGDLRSNNPSLGGHSKNSFFGLDQDTALDCVAEQLARALSAEQQTASTSSHASAECCPDVNCSAGIDADDPLQQPQPNSQSGRCEESSVVPPREGRGCDGKPTGHEVRFSRGKILREGCSERHGISGDDVVSKSSPLGESTASAQTRRDMLNDSSLCASPHPGIVSPASSLELLDLQHQIIDRLIRFHEMKRTRSTMFHPLIMALGFSVVLAGIAGTVVLRWNALSTRKGDSEAVQMDHGSLAVTCTPRGSRATD